MRLLRLKSKAFSLLFLASCPLWGEQNQTYPTAATTQIRYDTYVDDMVTVAKSSWTIKSSTWEYFNEGTFWIDSSEVKTWQWDHKLSTYTVRYFQMDEFLAMIVEETKDRVIIRDIASNTDIFWVWPSTSNVPDDWKGWCMERINGRDVYVYCP